MGVDTVMQRGGLYKTSDGRPSREQKLPRSLYSQRCGKFFYDVLWLFTAVRLETVRDTGLPRLDKDAPYFYDSHVFFCINVRPAGHPRGCCSEKGSLELRAHLKNRAKELGLSRVRINAAQCLDRCEFGPTMVIYPEGVWYRCENKEDVDRILKVHLVEGGRVTELLIQPDEVSA